MSNQEHVHILKQGVTIWNQWREGHPEILPDLSSLNFSHDLSISDLSHAHLRGTNLSRSVFMETRLSNADLREAQLWQTQLKDVDLRAADLSRARLFFAYLENTLLEGTDLSHTALCGTIFADVDFSLTQGLETVHHYGRSFVDAHTISRSRGKIPRNFLRGIGAPDAFIESLQGIAEYPFASYSCFLRYASEDEPFVKRLSADLQNNNVRCWYAAEDSKSNEPMRPDIDDVLRHHDKTLLVLSTHAVSSTWIEHEVKKARAKEHKEKRIILFPLCLDEAVLEMPLVAKLRRKRRVIDFSHWKNYAAYEEALDCLLYEFKREQSWEATSPFP
jgi:hypothetical protein